MMRILLSILALALTALGTSAYAAEATAPINIFDAARDGDVAAIKAYAAEGHDIEVMNRRGHTPFILATYSGHVSAAETLSELGSNVCATDQQGSHAMMGVVFKGYQPMLEWLLTNTKCDVNHQNYAGQTALMLAALFDRGDIATLLIDYGADPLIADHRGNTPHSLAMGQGLSKMISILKFHRNATQAKTPQL